MFNQQNRVNKLLYTIIMPVSFSTFVFLIEMFSHIFIFQPTKLLYYKIGNLFFQQHIKSRYGLGLIHFRVISLYICPLGISFLCLAKQGLYSSTAMTPTSKNRNLYAILTELQQIAFAKSEARLQEYIKIYAQKPWFDPTPTMLKNSHGGHSIQERKPLTRYKLDIPQMI